MADSINTIDGLLRNAALGKNNGVALVDAPNRADFFDGNSQRWTWSEVDSIVQSLATQLQNRGIRAGSAVGIQLPNVCELYSVGSGLKGSSYSYFLDFFLAKVVY